MGANQKGKKRGCWHKFNWKYALVNSIGKGLRTGPNKALVDTVVRQGQPYNIQGC